MYNINPVNNGIFLLRTKIQKKVFAYAAILVVPKTEWFVNTRYLPPKTVTAERKVCNKFQDTVKVSVK